MTPANMELSDTEDPPTHSHRSTTATNRVDHSKKPRIEEPDVL